MKNIKLAKKEYVVIEKKELESILSDLQLFAIMVNGDAQVAKIHNCDFVTGLNIESIIAKSRSTIEYIAEIESELI